MDESVLWLLLALIGLCLGLSIVINFRLFSRLQKKTAEVKSLQQRRTDFIANVSHELKTPLTSIKGYTETLQAGAVSDEKMAANFLRKIEDNTKRLDALIHDILDLSQLETSHTNLSLEEIEMDEFFRQLRENFQIRLDDKKQILDIRNKVPRLVADRHLLEQAFSNLLGNANRYCQEAALIEIHGQEADGTVEFRVQDNGPGIPEEDLPRIFERFYRADKSRNRDFGGTGLGLAIVKHILLSHEGSVKAFRNKEGGLSFHLRLPQKNSAS